MERTYNRGKCRLSKHPLRYLYIRDPGHRGGKEVERPFSIYLHHPTPLVAYLVGQGWGKEIRISNAEMLQTVIDDKNEKAAISVKFTWYRVDEMVERETITVQHWERREGEWLMVAEEYQSGTPF